MSRSHRERDVGTHVEEWAGFVGTGVAAADEDRDE